MKQVCFGKRSLSLVIASLAIGFAGCGEGSDSNLIVVTGTIKLKGEPVGPGMISFRPIGSAGGRRRGASSNFDAEGQFSLTTGRDGAGAQPGEYEVTILNDGEGIGDETSDSYIKGPIPRKYSDPLKSGLKRTVKPGEENVFDFDLE